MYLKAVCALNILAVIFYSICEILRSNNLAHTAFLTSIILLEVFSFTWVLSGKIK